MERDVTIVARAADASSVQRAAEAATKNYKSISGRDVNVSNSACHFSLTILVINLYGPSRSLLKVASRRTARAGLNSLRVVLGSQ
jgi:hypothetical protein